MEFSSVTEAKEYVVKVTSKAMTEDEIKSSIDFYHDLSTRSIDDNEKKIWLTEIKKLKEWKNSDEFKNGNYPQGIDELILEVVEWRAAVYSFQNVDTKRDAFKESGFYAQWLLGAVYGVFTVIGKLISKDNRDNSLRKLWFQLSPLMLQDKACTHEEVEYINQEMDKSKGRFTNSNSKVLLFRNKVIAHNEAIPSVTWDEVDHEISLLIRMWSLLVAWSSFGLFDPFRTDEQAFMGLESMFQADELSAIKSKRREYIKKVKEWSRNYAHNGLVDKGRSAFSSISSEVKVTNVETRF